METLATFFGHLEAYGDATLGIGCGAAVGAPPRFRVTRRGNLYDEAAQRTIWHTHGLGSIRHRRALATWWCGILNATAKPAASAPKPGASR